MYTQEDIDKILICREAIDKHRAFNQARAKSLTVATSVDEAKALIELKIGVATTITADSALKSTQDIKNILEEERTKSTLEMYATLKEQGFEDYTAFSNWHDKIVFEIFKGCCPIIGKCDWCGEKELREQNCIKLYGITDCTNRKLGVSSDLGAYLESFKRFKEGTTEIIKDKVSTISVCPKGHGYYNDIENIKELPIDIKWRA